MIRDRRVIAAIIVIGLFVFATPRLGERNRSEARAISSIRAIVSAELAYASLNSGNYGMLECLADPSCQPSLANHTRFLDPRLAAARDRDGYHFEFHPHPDPGPSARSSRPLLMRFAVVALPADADMARGHGFCSDDRQVIYVTDNGVAPRVERGRCIDTNKTLR